MCEEYFIKRPTHLHKEEICLFPDEIMVNILKVMTLRLRSLDQPLRIEPKKLRTFFAFTSTCTKWYRYRWTLLPYTYMTLVKHIQK
jgi:hypothetical protein